MRTAPKLSIALLSSLVLATGCSLLVNFDPDGQKCDTDSQCLEGYGCEAGVCREGVAPVVTSPCGNCAPGFKCLAASESCVPNTCLYTRCPVGSICNESLGTPTCRPVVSPSLGHPCTEDVDCSQGGSNRFCYRGAIQNDDEAGSLRTGVCVERCLPAGGGCLTEGASCREFPLSVDAGATQLCVPDNLLFGCSNDFDCLDSAFACTVFDNPNLGPATVCDAVLTTGAQPGAACTTTRADGGAGAYCENGLCLANRGTAGTCGSACAEGTCPTGQVCGQVQFTVAQTPRHVPMCLPAKTHCAGCLSDDACNADAPHCTRLGAGGNFFCLSRCSQTPGTFPSCPAGQQCSLLADAGYCVPDIGFCP